MNTPLSPPPNMTRNILLGMLFGIAAGLSIQQLRHYDLVNFVFFDHLVIVGGRVFVALLKMAVVPVVFVSLVCGTSQLSDTRRVGRLAIKTIGLYLCTTAVAISLALSIAHFIGLGSNTASKVIGQAQFVAKAAPSLKEVFINIVPSNIFAALSQGNMLQVIFFAIFLGLAIAQVGETGERIGNWFKDANNVIMRLIVMIMSLAPYGVFCLLANVFAETGLSGVTHLLAYFFTVVLVLLVHLFFTNSALLYFLAKRNPIDFFKKIRAAMLFAFSTSSSNASIPVVLNTVETKLGVDNSIASFTIPLGATINMDGTAIMQGVATVFIANLYQVNLGFEGYLTVVLMATLASIGTAGVPGVGLITLAMVLRQVGLPVEAIGLIIGVDRLLDMLRTAINISGDCAISCVLSSSSTKNSALEKS